MCLLACLRACIPYSGCVVALWCARIKPSRSKNTYVQKAGIQSCLCCVKTPRHGETASECAAKSICKNSKYHQPLVKLFPGLPALTKRQKAKYLDPTRCQTKLIPPPILSPSSYRDAPGCTYTTSPPPVISSLSAVISPLFSCFASCISLCP